MHFRPVFFVLCFVTTLLAKGAVHAFDQGSNREEEGPAQTLRVSNNHPFAIRESLTFLLPPELAESQGSLLAVSHSVTGGTVEAHYIPIQADPASGNRTAQAWIDVQLRPNESRVYNFQEIGGAGNADKKRAELKGTFPSNLPRKMEWPGGATVELFDVALVEMPRHVRPDSDEARAAMAEAAPLAFELQSAKHGLVRSELFYQSAPAGGHQVEVHYSLYASGITDIEITIHPGELGSADTSLSLMKKIPAPADRIGRVHQQGETSTIAPGDTTAGSADWLAWGQPENPGDQAILTGHHPFREQVARLENEWHVIAETTRRSDAGAIGQTGAATQLNYRLLPAKSRSLEEVHQAFIAFVGYQHRDFTEKELHVSFGLDGVRFGATIPALRGDEPPSLRNETRRDMRIANALGLDLIRISGFNSPDSTQNYLSQGDGGGMLKHLEFQAETARETGLKLFLQLSLSPADARLVAERFGDVIAFYEIDNSDESADSSEHWERLRDEVLAVQPEAVVLLSQHSAPLDGFQAIGRHLIQPVNEPLGLIENAALSLAREAGASGVIPIVSAFTPETDRRESEGARANQLFAAYESLLAQGSIPLIVNSSLTESMDGTSRGNHLLRVDGTPTIKAHAFNEIIRRYGPDDNRLKTLEISAPVISIRPGETKTVAVKFTNSSNQPLEITTRPLLPKGLDGASADQTITIRPRQSQTVERTITAAEDLPPGFYHFFEQANYADTIRIGWSYATYRAAPILDLTPSPAAIPYAGGLASFDKTNLSNLRYVVFGNRASEVEVDWAERLCNSLRYVTGTNIRQWPDNQLASDQKSRSHLLIGNQESNSQIAEIADLLPLNPLELKPGEGVVMAIAHPTEPKRFVIIVSGRDSAGIEKAATDLMRRYGQNGRVNATQQTW